MTSKKLVSISDVEGDDPRSQFLRARAVYMTNQPFTKAENKKYSVQDKNFLRSIQVSRGVDKKEAIKLLKQTKKDRAYGAALSDDICKNYEQGIVYQPPPLYDGRSIGGGGKIKKPVKPVKPIKPKKVKKSKKGEKGAPKNKMYKYAGVAGMASKARKDRFTPLGGKSRRYIDTSNGEEISRRERDKRLVL